MGIQRDILSNCGWGPAQLIGFGPSLQTGELLKLELFVKEFPDRFDEFNIITGQQSGEIYWNESSDKALARWTELTGRE